MTHYIHCNAYFNNVVTRRESDNKNHVIFCKTTINWFEISRVIGPIFFAS